MRFVPLIGPVGGLIILLRPLDFLSSYASLTAELQSRLTAKLNQYVKINETVDGWTTLNPQDGAGHQVYPLQLDYLP